METLTECNLCQSKRFSVFTKKRGSHTNKVLTIVQCDHCGLMFVTPRLDAEENRNLYDEDYFQGRGFDGSVAYVMLDEEEEQRRLESLGIIQKIRIFRPEPDLRILDVGCGTGGLLCELERAGYTQIEGLEFSPYAASIAQRRSRAVVHVGDILDVDLGIERFDVINATEVIEHLRDPMAFFHKVRSLLAPTGIFVYSTGNAEGPYAKWLGRRWPYLVPEGHLFYYNPSTLARYFERAGLGIIDPRSLPRPTRRAVLRCDDEIAFAQLGYVGKSDGGIKGLLFRAVFAMCRQARPAARRSSGKLTATDRLASSLAVNGCMW
jgi:2-polyprenyl-3-methyl-5-hydroxy-6-metoxy-1,4-benzoquinol methylase